MSFRETLNQNPKLGFGIGVGVVVVGIAAAIFALRGGPKSDQPTILTDKGFFTDDDGKTLFADDLTNVPPFDHNGKKAVRAIVFTAGNGQRFIGWLLQYEPPAKKKVEEALSNAKGDAPGRYLNLEHPSVKKPGSPTWVKYNVASSNAEYDKVTAIANLEPPDHDVNAVRGPIFPDTSDLKKQ